jgi:twinkle protein
MSLISQEIVSIPKRGLTEETCRKWGYGVAKINGVPAQVANYCDESGRPVAQKVRYKNKKFAILGDADKMSLFGQHLWRDGGKMITVCEGEIDALTVSQLFGNKWPVVSIPHGAQSASKYIAKSIDWLERFETVVLCFDNDDAGKAAAQECALLFTPGKVKIVSNLPGKDPNECLMASKGKEVVDAIWAAKTFRPDGVIPGEEMWPIISTDEDVPTIPYPWEGLNSKLMGIRSGELVTITSGSGIGKSSVCRELAYWLMQKGAKVGYIALEENVRRTGENLMALHMGIPRYFWKDREVTMDQKREAFDATLGQGNIVLYDHWGSCESDNLISQIRYMARGMGCTHIFLDHLSIVVSGLDEGDERRIIDNTMTKLRSLVEETKISMFVVSHLKRPAGQGHEEGAQTSLSQLRGSHAIAQLSDCCIGLERNQQDIENPHRTSVRILKNRWCGDNGLCACLEYDRDTGRLMEVAIQPDISQFIDVES